MVNYLATFVCVCTVSLTTVVFTCAHSGDQSVSLLNIFDSNKSNFYVVL
jgi:hypothetical protein